LGDIYNLAVFYYLSASEIWSEKRCGLGVSSLIRGGATVQGIIF